MGTRLLMLGGVNHPHVEHLALGLRARRFDVVVAGDAVPGLPVSVLEAEGFRLLPAPLLRRGSARGMVQHVRWIRRLLETERPEVVHAHWLCGFAALAAVARAEPLVSMAWGSDVYRARRLQEVANRVAVRRSALVMADSQDLLDRVIELGADRRRSVLVNWGVDLARFRPADPQEKAALREQLGLGPGPVILSMRSLMPIYNPRVILDAWARLAAERPDAQFVLKHMGVVTTDVGELPFPERVHVVGHIPYERMADYYRAADAAVSIASSDSAPRSVFEAMACGAACVISDLPWTHEQMADGREALLVPIDAEAVAAALRRVLDEPGTARTLAENGRRLVEREHDRELHLDRLAETYRSLLAPPADGKIRAVKRAIVLAGGAGTRLRPYTAVLPKPLMPVGDRPVLDIVLRQLARHGFKHVTIAVGHLGQLIEAVCGDGDLYGLRVDYHREPHPLGTVGSLALIDGLDSDFLVMNGDVLTDMDYAVMLDDHVRSGAVATIATTGRQVEISLGVIVLDDPADDRRITGYIEKPTFDYDVSMGVYCFSPRAVEYIDPGARLDFPDLVLRLLDAGEEVRSYRPGGYWLDIGRHDDYEAAQAEFDEVRDRLLPGGG